MIVIKELEIIQVLLLLFHNFMMAVSLPQSKLAINPEMAMPSPFAQVAGQYRCCPLFPFTLSPPRDNV